MELVSEVRLSRLLERTQLTHTFMIASVFQTRVAKFGVETHCKRGRASCRQFLVAAVCMRPGTWIMSGQSSSIRGSYSVNVP
jgi:hypothetical protein